MLAAKKTQIYNKDTKKMEDVTWVTNASEVVFNDGETLQFKLNSGQLQGKDGKDGLDGVDGANGKDGKDGTDGADGVTTTMTVPGCATWVNVGSCTLQNAGVTIAEKTGTGAQFIQVTIDKEVFYGYVMKLSNGAWAGTLINFLSSNGQYTVWDCCRNGTGIAYVQTYPAQESAISNNLKYYDGLYHGNLGSTSEIKKMAKNIITKVPSGNGAWCSIIVGNRKWWGFWITITNTVGGGLFFSWDNGECDVYTIYADSSTGAGGANRISGAANPNAPSGTNAAMFVTTSQLAGEIQEIYRTAKTYCDETFVTKSSTNDYVTKSQLTNEITNIYQTVKTYCDQHYAPIGNYVKNNGWNQKSSDTLDTSSTQGMLAYIARALGY